MVFDYVNFFDLTNVLVHVILFPLNIVLRTFFDLRNCTLSMQEGGPDGFCGCHEIF